jgi:hypothetical protein
MLLTPTTVQKSSFIKTEDYGSKESNSRGSPGTGFIGDPVQSFVSRGTFCSIPHLLSDLFQVFGKKRFNLNDRISRSHWVI